MGGRGDSDCPVGSQCGQLHGRNQWHYRLARRLVGYDCPLGGSSSSNISPGLSRGSLHRVRLGVSANQLPSCDDVPGRLGKLPFRRPNRRRRDLCRCDVRRPGPGRRAFDPLSRRHRLHALAEVALSRTSDGGAPRPRIPAHQRSTGLLARGSGTRNDHHVDRHHGGVGHSARSWYRCSCGRVDFLPQCGAAHARIKSENRGLTIAIRYAYAVVRSSSRFFCTPRGHSASASAKSNRSSTRISTATGPSARHWTRSGPAGHVLEIRLGNRSGHPEVLRHLLLGPCRQDGRGTHRRHVCGAVRGAVARCAQSDARRVAEGAVLRNPARVRGVAGAAEAIHALRFMHYASCTTRSTCG